MWKSYQMGNHMVSMDYQWITQWYRSWIIHGCHGWSHQLLWAMASRRPQREGSGAAGCFTWKMLGRALLSLVFSLFDGVIMRLANGLIWSKKMYCLWVVPWRSLFVSVWVVPCSFVILPGHIGRPQDAGIKKIHSGAIHFMPRIGTPVKRTCRFNRVFAVLREELWKDFSHGSQGWVLPLMARLYDADASSRPIPRCTVENWDFIGLAARK